MQQTLEKVTIFDTTLRDGEQGADASMSSEDKISIALALEESGVDVIEAGFPVASAEVFRVVEEVAKQTNKVQVCALARSLPGDVLAAAEAIRAAGDRGRIHVFVATEADHMLIKLNRTPDQVLDMIHQSVSKARAAVTDVQFSPEVGATSEFGFLCQSIRVAIAAGATTINVPDTKGYCLPFEYGEVFSKLRQAIPELSGCVLSAHCHDDRGLATANTLEAMRSGARQVECTVNGIGERAGNTSLEEVVMAIELRGDALGVSQDFDTTQLQKLSTMVERASSIRVSPNKAFVGRNAFAHQSGIHQDGTLKDPRLYEVCDPTLVGNVRRMPVGKLSGRNGVHARLVDLGFQLSASEVDVIYQRFVADIETRSASADDVLRECVAQL